MFIYIRNFRKKLIGILIVIIMVMSIIILKLKCIDKSQMMIGAFMHDKKESSYENGLQEFNGDEYYESDERFQRPSKLAAVKLKYNFRPKDKDEVPPYVAEEFPAIYQSSEEVIHGYYAILKNAANMIGYDGGCGTILWNDTYAYRLFSDDMNADVTLEQFKDSFKGTGAMNLLHLQPAY